MIEIEEPSEKSVVEKRVANNPSAYLIKRNINRVFKDGDLEDLPALDSRDSRIMWGSGKRPNLTSTI